MLNEAPVRAPQLPADPAAWLNTEGIALSLPALRGCVVLLDFWTYGCINCLHVLPDLKYLESKYADRPFVVVGVHSGKFDNERQRDNIQSALLRHDIRHPIVCDNDHRVWQEYDVHAWPTLGIIDPEGYYLGSVSGEGHRDELDQIIGQLLTGLAAKTPVGKNLPGQVSSHDFTREQSKEHSKAPLPEQTVSAPAPLRFPGKIVADGIGQRLFVADSGHHRIVVCSLDGSNTRFIGSSEAGWTDGTWQEARFSFPQGMALVGDALYVCDCDNHLLRRIDLALQMVTTVVGTGAQSHARTPGGPGTTTPLSSPWDVCYHQLQEGLLTLALAGIHQIWRYDLRTGEVLPYAGNGREARIDGGLRAASFAQPSGLAVEERALYIADSESSSLRRILISPDTGAEIVETATGGDLYAWGDADGTGDSACLQHPLGVCAYRGAVYITDTYNHKIKVFDPLANSLRTLAGTGKPGLANGFGDMAQFCEPGGLSAANGFLYIADTNNHCLRLLDLDTNIVSTLDIYSEG